MSGKDAARCTTRGAAHVALKEVPLRDRRVTFRRTSYGHYKPRASRLRFCESICSFTRAEPQPHASTFRSAPYQSSLGQGSAKPPEWKQPNVSCVAPSRKAQLVGTKPSPSASSNRTRGINTDPFIISKAEAPLNLEATRFLAFDRALLCTLTNLTKH